MEESTPQTGRYQQKDGPPLIGERKRKKIICSLSALLFLCLGLTGCAASDTDSTAVTATPRVTATPTALPTILPSPTPTFLPNMEIFETVWQAVADGFYDVNMNGVDWAAIHDLYQPRVAAAGDGEAYYRLLNGMLFELGVSHIGLLPPEMADQLDPITFPAGSVGLDVRLLQEQIVVTAVQPDSPAASTAIKPGYVFNAINGLSAIDLLQETMQRPALNERDRRGMITQAVRAKLYGDPGQQVTISYLDASDQAHEETLTYAPRPGKQTLLMPDLPPAYVEFTARRLSPEIGYLGFSGFLPGVEEDIFAAVDEMSDTEALIIDLRGNPGGVFPVRKAVAEKLVGERLLFWQYQQRERLETVYLNGIPSAYQGEVIILIDSLSASSSEEFAGGMQAIGRATIVGTPSPGSCLTAEILPLENGAILIYPFGQSQTADGYILENNGVVPDVAVELDRDSLLAGRDTQLETAIAVAGD